MRVLWASALVLAGMAMPAQAAERVTLRSGFSVDCVRHEVVGDKLRLMMASGAGANYMDVAADAVVGIERVPDVVVAPVAVLEAAPGLPGVATGDARLSGAAMAPMLAESGARHRVDADLLASVVRAESGGHSRAVSRTGARGLMQLMPGTATAMGVGDSFEPAANIEGGSAYLDRLLVRYHDDMTLALAAYNAGPGAVDRWHGVPPYRETRVYVARVIREFNRRKLAAVAGGTAGKMAASGASAALLMADAGRGPR